MSNAPSKPVSFSRPKVGYFSNRPRMCVCVIKGQVVPVPVAARSKAWVCGRSLAGIMGSNPAGAWMSVMCVVCCQVKVSATG